MHGLSVLRRWAFTKHVGDVDGSSEAKASNGRGRPVKFVGVLRGRLTACMACPCYVVGRLLKHVGDVDGSSEANAGGRRGRPVRFVGVLRGRLTACMARLCYVVGRL